MINHSKALRTVGEYVVLTVACFIFAVCWECFMIPNGMSAGGTMGFCTILQYATGGFLPAQYSYLAINALLIIIAVIAMGIGFGFKTIYCIVMSSVAMGVLENLEIIHCVPGEFFYVEEKVLIPLLAGVCEATGIGLVIRYGGSTGGTDIIAIMVNKYWPVSLSTVFLYTDLAVCAMLLFLPGKTFSDMCYGLEELITFSLMIDFIVGGKKSSYQLMVFSEKYERLADFIIKEMERGVTVLKAQGWFTRSEKNVLLILVSQKELPLLTKVIKELDPRAFMSVTPVGSVYGEGFEEIKTGISLKAKDNKSNDNAS